MSYKRSVLSLSLFLPDHSTLGKRKIKGLHLNQQQSRTTVSPSSPTTTKKTAPGYVNAGITSYWHSGYSGFDGMEVEIHVASIAPPPRNDKSAPKPSLLAPRDQSNVIENQLAKVEVEEIVLVTLVLLLWVGAIALFFNRWGKIRMLEPYQPKFNNQEPHRPSCPSGSSTVNPPLSNSLPRIQKVATQRMSFSKYNVNALTDPLSILPSPIIKRPRRSSVFVGSSLMLNKSPRRAKSAADIHYIGVMDNRRLSSSLTGSLTPFVSRDRRPSLITIERPSERPIFISSRRRPSVSIERPQFPKGRRSSCFVMERTSSTTHRNCNSFESSAVWRTPSMTVTNERRSCGSIALPSDNKSDDGGDFIPLEYIKRQPRKPKISRSFEQPIKPKVKPERMALSLDVSSISNISRKSSLPEKDRSFPGSLRLDEITAAEPLLENQ
ncbi:uncharacterized protein [Euwallacea similis]|uniref:uncharacterized protein isoform X3 n=1 Tax=Euwallacea similis TaxID=1736056 RepID=UPI00344CA2EB